MILPKFEIFAEIRDFAEVRDFRRNPRFSPKSEIFAQVREFRRSPRFSPKSEIFAEVGVPSASEVRALARSER